MQLRWRPPGGAKAGRALRFELQQATDPGFAHAKVRYLGPERATFVSGLPEGTFHFRVRAVTPDGRKGPWSKARMVRVRYVSRRVVAVLMILGFLLLGATLAVILHGHRATRSLPAARVGAQDEDRPEDRHEDEGSPT